MNGKPDPKIIHGTRGRCSTCGEKFKRFTYGQSLCEECREVEYPQFYEKEVVAQRTGAILRLPQTDKTSNSI